MRFRLSQKILSLSLVTTAIMIGTMLLLGFNISRQSVQEGAARFVLDKMSNLMYQVDELLANYQTQLQIISTDPIFAEVLSSNGISASSTQVDLSRRLSNLLVYSGPWDALLLVDESGKTVSAASLREGNTLIGLYPEETPLLARAALAPVVSGDAVSRGGTTMLSYVLAVRAFDQGRERIVGYVVGRIAWRSVEDVLSRDEGSISLFRSDGSVIASVGEATAEAFSSAEVASFSKNEDSRLTTIGGTERISTLTREKGVPNYDGNSWVLGSVRDATAYIATESRSIQEIIILAAVALFILSLISLVVLSRAVVRPVRTLRDGANALASGDFSKRIELGTRDEIGELASAFQTMSDKLSGLYASLEQRVREKTKALEENVRELETSKQTTERALRAAEEAEQKMREKSKQVEDAFNEVQRFARTADRARLTYSLLISSIGEGVIVIDADRRITVLNETGERMIGVKFDDAKGKDSRELFVLLSNTRAELDDDFMVPILAEGKLHAIRYFYLRRKSDNKEIPISGVIAPITDEKSGGIVRGAIFTLHDVAEEKVLEDARIGFISTASHQLRTPLTSMRWFAEMLHDGDAGAINEEQMRFLDRISEGIERMIGLVNMLLQMARVEAGRVAIEPTPVNLKEMTETLVKSIEVQLKEHNQSIEVTAEPDPPPLIPLDRDYPWQIIQNLLTNALRYSFDGTTTKVHIKQEGDHVVFSVTDHGIGIPREAQAKLFEKFFRAENALARVPSGTGLGLSLAKSLVEEMGGRLWFESTEGVGSTFAFTVPLSGMRARKGEVKLSV